MDTAKVVVKALNDKFKAEWKLGVLPLLERMQVPQRIELWLLVAGLSIKKQEELIGWQVEHFRGSYQSFDNTDERKDAASTEEPESAPVLASRPSQIRRDEVEKMNGPELRELITEAFSASVARESVKRKELWALYRKANNLEPCKVPGTTNGLTGVTILFI